MLHISWCILFSNMLVRWMPHVSTRIFGILLKIEPTHQIKTMFLHQLGKLFFNVLIRMRYQINQLQWNLFMLKPQPVTREGDSTATLRGYELFGVT